MMNSAYGRRLLRKHTGNLASDGSLEARPLTAALPPSGGFLESSSDVSPVMAPPAKKRRILVTSETPRYRKIGDRFIPTRDRNNWLTKFATITEDGHSGLRRKATENGRWNCDGSAYSCLLKNELLGAGIEDVKDQYDERGALVPLNGRNLFKYTLADRSGHGSGVETSAVASNSLSPVSFQSQKLLRSARKITQKISSQPFKVLYAPMLADDFYINPIDWSSQNILSVGLGSRAYILSARTEQFTVLCNLSESGHSVTSVAWNEQGNLLAVGTDYGAVQIWDTVAEKPIKMMEGQSGRVGALAWNGDVVTSGSYDGLIIERDVRTPSLVLERRSAFHEREVCGLKWSPCKQYLASGGDDNRLLVWDLRSLSPVQDYTEHSAAVKAIAWSPHHRGLLASGGGAADRCIHIWDSLTGQAVKRVDTGSQVSNVAWSKDSHELVSTHGDFQDQIRLWKYPGLTQLASLTAHSARVLYMAVSPDGEAVVTGAADETLCFWDMFRKPHSQKESHSPLELYNTIR